MDSLHQIFITFGIWFFSWNFLLTFMERKKINSLTKKRLESMEKILKVLSPILTEYSKEKNISIVMDKKYIIVGKTELNLTDDILKLLNNKIKKIKIN